MKNGRRKENLQIETKHSNHWVKCELKQTVVGYKVQHREQSYCYCDSYLQCQGGRRLVGVITF